MDKIRTIDTLTIESSVLCHNFINTVYAWRGQNLHEYLQSYDDLMAWCRKLSVLDEALLRSLSATASSHPAEAEQALEKIKSVRALLYQLVSRIAEGKTNFAELLTEINPLMVDAMAHFKIAFSSGTFELKLQVENGDLLAPLWPVLLSVRDMLLQTDLSRVGECPTCGWVFLDQTRNGTRRWCSPVECGTQDKMKRYNQRKKAASS